MGEPIRPERPPVPLTETPEFKAAVAQAAAEAAATAIAQFAAAQQGAAPTTDAQSLLQGLALAIAEMSHQGDKRDKPIDPKVLAARAAAFDRMKALILEAQSLPKGDPRRPKYHATSKLNFADHMIEPYRRDPATKKAVHVEFRWCLEPNDAMVPLNDMAKAIYAEYRAYHGNKSEYTKEPRKQVWLTDHGLIVEGAPPARREVALSDSDHEEDVLDFGEGPFDPNAKNVRVLGTSHKPARQYNAGQPN